MAFIFEKLSVYQEAVNFAEGNGRFHTKDRNNFFYIARGSVHECVPLLELISRKKLIPNNEKIQLLTQLEKIAKMISGLIK